MKILSVFVSGELAVIKGPSVLREYIGPKRATNQQPPANSFYRGRSWQVACEKLHNEARLKPGNL